MNIIPLKKKAITYGSVSSKKDTLLKGKGYGERERLEIIGYKEEYEAVTHRPTSNHT